MEKSNKRGKIPQSDWPAIMARYEAGETLASIAKTYDCSPPAISYVVSRSRARNSEIDTSAAVDADTSAAVTEPQLIKAHSSEAAAEKPAAATAEPAGRTSPVPVTVAAAITEPVSLAAPAPARQSPTEPVPVQSGVAHPNEAYPNEAAASDRNGQRPPSDVGNNPAPRNGNGGGNAGGNGGPERSRDTGFPGLPPRAAPRQEVPSRGLNGGSNGGLNGGQHSGGDQRRTLHLSLGNGDGAAANGSASGSGSPVGSAQSDPPPTRPTPVEPAHLEQPSRSQPGSGAAPQHHNGDDRTDTRPPPAPYREQGRYGYSRERYEPETAPRRDAGGSFIDTELRARVDTDIAAFLSAFDAALAQDTQDSRTALREATDRLLRAGARTRIELERLEARVPLPPRDAAIRAEPAWRSR
jgi:hypothetical protein